jgi:gliding motility-associated-like protein
VFKFNPIRLVHRAGKRFFLLTISLVMAIAVSAQEICNNAIDDDGDGLIDLNDDECTCTGFGGSSNLSSLIPNSSFEDRSCCPTGYSQLNCADTWIQASNPTSDYWHMCGQAGSSFDGGTVLPPPDGEGFVGFINMSGWQEYVGACLTSTMTAGQQYDFTFWFGHTNNSPPIELTFYGTPSCGDLPFNSNDCPTGIGGFITLGSSTMGGGSGWVEEQVSFVPPIDINAIVIGGACGSGGARTYYYLDDLTLVSTESFEVLSIQQLGQYCDNNIVLDAEADTFGGVWQWYKDGIALIGETSDDYSVPAGMAGVGVYTATYTILDQCESIDIEVVAPDFPIADFLADDVCFPADVVFTDQSSVASGSITNWSWDFGDNSISSQPSPTHNYAIAGTFTVELTITTDINCTASYQTDVSVFPKPEADYSVTPGCLGDPTVFADQSMVDAPVNINQYEWDFGDSNTSAVQNPSNYYAAENSYNVELIVTTADGCKDTAISVVDVHPSPEIAVSGSDECVLDDVVFGNTSSISSGSIDMHDWDFGDNQTSSDAAPVHVYTSSNVYTVIYTATSNEGCVSDTTFQVNSWPNPVADLTVSDVCADSPIALTDNSSVTAPSVIDVIELDLGDNSGIQSTVPTNYQYASPGAYNIELVVVTQHSCNDTIELVSNVYDMPVADFSFVNICEDDSAQFNDMSSIPNGTINSWLWNLGNGQTSTLSQPEEQEYPADGFYDVSLIVSSGFGCADTLEDQIEVYPVPIADFTFDSVCFPLEIQFTDLSEPNGAYDISSWLWTFSDNQTSMDQNPLMGFFGPGMYSAELLISNGPGCKSTVEKGNAVVHPKPVADFEDGLATCLEDTIFFIDGSSLLPVTDDQIISWSWDLDDTNMLTSQNGFHIYGNPNLYNVELTVETNHQCTDAQTRVVEIYPLPEVDFTSTPYEGCAPLQVNFNDLSTISSPYALASWEWNLGIDSSIAQSPNPMLIYNPEMDPLDVNQYNISLTVTSMNGCSTDIFRPNYITVYPKPEALFAVDDDVKNIIKPEFVFTDLSTENVALWNWDFGDGTNSDVQNPVHWYDEVGTYPIELIVETQYGCLDTIGYEVKVEPVFTFYVPSSFTPDENGINDEFFGVGEGYTFYSMFIYDRWGELIFESNDDQYHWDGTYKGEKVQQGTYVYQFYLLDWQGHDHQYKGIVTLHR